MRLTASVKGRAGSSGAAGTPHTVADRASRLPRPVRATALVSLLALVAASCGGGSSGPKTAKEGPPHSGGSVVYGLDAESSGGWCPRNAQLAAAGIIENDAIYDQLAYPNDKGQIVPYLAQSITNSADYRTWTIKIRPNILFQDGEKLDAAAVKLNIDAVRTGPLGAYVLNDITDTVVVDPLTVDVKMAKPWIAFPWVLFGTGRGAMAAPKQLNSPNCANELIGTGPFMLKEWIPNDHMTVVRNPHYWRKDSAGRQLPYLDQITFRPITDATQRLNALKTGQIDMMMTDNGDTIYQIRQTEKSGAITAVENQKSAEIGYTMLRVDKPPFDDIVAREAAAYASNPDEINQVIYHGVETRTDTPFAPDVFGYVKEPRQPPITFDLSKAKQLVSQYKAAHGGHFDLTLSSTNDPNVIKQAQLLQSQWQAAGMNVKLRSADQATLINQALGGDFQATLWRNHPGADPDTQLPWWHSGSPVNFQNIKDPRIDHDLDEARSATDPAVRKADYEDLQREFGAQLYSLWGFYARWVIASKPNIHGITGVDLPDGGTPGIVASVFPTIGLWRS
jgi:peptide/nickel transport system substrate-binding protein